MNHLLPLFLFLPLLLGAQVTDTDGDWEDHYVTLENTPEADLMVRTGDIDNLGFGWPADFDPFSGNSTRAHSFPWTIDTLDPSGTDRIMVISSFVGRPPGGNDGYTATTKRPENEVRPITVTFDPVSSVTAATLQLFVDDFQAPVWRANYQVFIDSIRINDLEDIINTLRQTGPIGKIITYSLPDHLLYLLDDGSLAIEFDDFASGAGDGYAIDFVKLLINPREAQDRNAVVEGKVTRFVDGTGIPGVVVSTSYTLSATTDDQGSYRIEKLRPGINQLTTFAAGYGAESATIDLTANQTQTINFQLTAPAPALTYSSPTDGQSGVATTSPINLVFDQEIDTASFNSTSVVLSGEQRDIPGSFGVSGDTLIFTPEGLDSNRQYLLTVTTRLQNTASLHLAENISIRFSTIGDATSVRGVPSVPVLQVYPNPLQDNLLRVAAPSAATSYRIYNQLGQAIQTGASRPDQVLATNLAPGLYVLHLLGEGNRPVGLARFVKR